MELSNWQLDPALAPEEFTSAKALAAPRMACRAKLPPGMKPMVKTALAKPASGNEAAKPMIGGK